MLTIYISMNSRLVQYIDSYDPPLKGLQEDLNFVSPRIGEVILIQKLLFVFAKLFKILDVCVHFTEFSCFLHNLLACLFLFYDISAPIALTLPVCLGLLLSCIDFLRNCIFIYVHSGQLPSSFSSQKSYFPKSLVCVTVLS